MLLKNNNIAVIFILLITLAIHIPFLDKPVHIDDIAFLNMSQMVGWNPIKAESHDTYYMGRVLPELLPYESTHPILIPYLQKTLNWFFDHKFMVFHLVFSVFTFFTLSGIYLICNNLFPRNGFHACLLILWAATPAFIINAHNMMTDVPALGMGLMGMGLYFLWLKNNSRITCTSSILFLTFSIFTTYQSVLLLIPLALYQLLSGKDQIKKLFPLFIPPLILLAWLVTIYINYDIFPFLSSRIEGDNIAGHVEMGMGWKSWLSKGLFNLATTGLTLLPLVFIYLIYSPKKLFFIKNIILVSVPFIIYASLFSNLPPAYKILYIIYLSAGAFFICHFYYCLFQKLYDDKKRSSAAFFMSWHFIFFLAVTFLFPFASARYILPSLVPLVVFLYFDISDRHLSPVEVKVLRAIIILSAAFGFLGARADYDHAESYKTFAEEVKITRQQKKNSFNVWYVGEWGMRYYMDAHGANYLLASQKNLPPGDLVIIPEMPRLWSPDSMLTPRLKGFATREFHTAVPLRVFNRRSHAGFYCHFWGELPLSFSMNNPVEFFQIYKVK